MKVHNQALKKFQQEEDRRLNMEDDTVNGIFNILEKATELYKKKWAMVPQTPKLA